MNSADLLKQGLQYYSKGQYSESISCYNAALKSDPKCKEALNNKGITLETMNRLEEAMYC